MKRAPIKQYDLVEEVAKLQKSSPLDGKAILNADGHEMLNGTPVAPPIGYKKQPSMFENIRNMVRSERLAQEAEALGAETFEEADDHEIGDDYEPSTPYEMNFDPPPIQPDPVQEPLSSPEPAEPAAEPQPAPTPPKVKTPKVPKED